MMTIMSHQPARGGSPARLGQLTHPLTSSWDLWSPRLTRILRFFLSCQGCLRAIEKATKIRHGLLRDLSFIFLFVLLSDVSRKIWAPVHSSTWPESFVIQVSTGCPPFNPPPPTHHTTNPPAYQLFFYKAQFLGFLSAHHLFSDTVQDTFSLKLIVLKTEISWFSRAPPSS